MHSRQSSRSGRRSRWGRRLAWLLAGGLAVYVVLVAALFVIMCQPPERFGRIMVYTPDLVMAFVPAETMWTIARNGPAHAGDMAPDFVLSTVDRRSQVTLSSFRGKRPVVLVFGSYT